MTAAYALPNVYSSFLQSGGVSSAAKEIRKIESCNYFKYRVGLSPYQAALNEIETLRSIATHENWDNLGSPPLSIETYHKGLEFLSKIPTGMPMPGITSDHDGEINFDWISSSGSNLSVSLSETGRVTYAGYISAHKKTSGTTVFGGRIPQEIIAWIDIFRS